MSEQISRLEMEAVVPFSLYIQLESGANADLEVVSEASIALVAAARELAFVFDPSVFLRVELIDGTEGSLWLNTKLKAHGVRTPTQILSAGLVAGTLGGFFASSVGGTIFQDLWHTYIFNPPSGPALLQSYVNDALERSEAHVKKGAAQKQIQDVYRALRGDRHISGVGAAPDRKMLPALVVPRSEFNVRAGSASAIEPPPTKRVSRNRVILTLVSPVLLEKNRSWTFRFAGREVGCHMKDEKFLSDLAAGRLNVKLVPDIRMDVNLEVKESFVKGAWEVKERNILHVYDTVEPMAAGQGNLLPDGAN